VIPALDVKSIYDVPIAYHKEGLDEEVLAAFGIDRRAGAALTRWDRDFRAASRQSGRRGDHRHRRQVHGLKDAYKSLIEALVHGGIANRVKVNIEWIESEIFEKEDPAPWLRTCTAFWCPAASASAARKARSRRRNSPGTQGSLFRHLLRHADGGARGGPQSGRHRRMPMSTEFGDTKEPVVGLMTEWLAGNS
jgi:CTP synthase